MATLLPLVLANCVPIVGVLAFGWDLRSIMFVYWLETAVVALYSVPRIVMVGGSFTLAWMPLHLAMLGVFMQFHLMMILAFGPKTGIGFFPPEVVQALAAKTWGGAVGLMVSHGVTFVVHFLGDREYERTTVNEQVLAPWKRIYLMQATTIAGAWAIMLFDAPVGALVALAILKIIVDLHGHQGERAGSRSATAPQPAAIAATTGSKDAGVLTLFGYFLILCAVLMVASTAWASYRAAHLRAQWPTVEARVTDCRVREIVSRKGQAPSYSVRCGFQYDVNGVTRTESISTQATRDPDTLARMRSWVARHRRGTIQPIHYDPAAPERISLGEFGETIDPSQAGQTLWAAAGFGCAGGLLLLGALWSSRRQSPPPAHATGAAV